MCLHTLTDKLNAYPYFKIILNCPKVILGMCMFGFECRVSACLCTLTGLVFFDPSVLAPSIVSVNVLSTC